MSKLTLKSIELEDADDSVLKLYTNKYRTRFVPEVEDRYQVVIARKQKPYTRLLLAIFIVLYVLFGACDYFVLKSDVIPVWLIRYLLGLPVLLSCYFLLTTRWIEAYYQLFLVIMLSLVIFTTYMMVFFLPEEIYHLYTSSILAMVMGGLSLTRIGYVGAAMSGAVYLLMSLVSHYQVNNINIVAVYYLLLESWVVVLCVVSAYSHERVSRHDFLQRIFIQRKNARLRTAYERLKDLVDIDALTGISNRRHFDQVLDAEWRRAKRRQYPLSLLMVDIDFFKAYNDNMGHVRGDECLKEVAQGLSNYARRPGDLVARYGGEEFGVILPALAIDEAQAAAEALCKRVQDLAIPHPDSKVAKVVTVSIGVAVQIPNKRNEKSDLIKLADDALYFAKKHGRNRVEVVAAENMEFEEIN